MREATSFERLLARVALSGCDLVGKSPAPSTASVEVRWRDCVSASARRENEQQRSAFPSERNGGGSDDFRGATLR